MGQSRKRVDAAFGTAVAQVPRFRTTTHVRERRDREGVGSPATPSGEEISPGNDQESQRSERADCQRRAPCKAPGGGSQAWGCRSPGISVTLQAQDVRL